MIRHAHHGNDHGKPKRNSKCPQDATSAPSEIRTQLPGLYFFIFMNVAMPSNVLSFLLKSHVNTAIYIPTDCTR